MRKLTKFMVGLLTAATLTTGLFGVTALAAESTGWVKQGTEWTYVKEDGTKVTNNWYKVDGLWYHFDETGKMQKGWLDDTDGKRYYFDGSGAMVKGWVKSGDQWYYMGGDGAMKTGWVKDADQWYYLHEDGSMQKGWFEDTDGELYYFNGAGAMAKGFVKTKGYNSYDTNEHWYYMGGTGAMKTGWVKDNGKWYYMSELDINKGVMATGFVSDWESNKTYYCRSNGEMATGWVKVETYDTFWYYFLADGSGADGWRKVDGQWYYFTSGRMNTGLIEDGNQSYYLNPNGIMQTGVKTLQGYHSAQYGDWYQSEEAMDAADTRQDKTFYFHPDGHMAHDETVNGQYYDITGAAAADRSMHPDQWTYVSQDFTFVVPEAWRLDGLRVVGHVNGRTLTVYYKNHELVSLETYEDAFYPTYSSDGYPIFNVDYVKVGQKDVEMNYTNYVFLAELSDRASHNMGYLEERLVPDSELLSNDFRTILKMLSGDDVDVEKYYHKNPWSDFYEMKGFGYTRKVELNMKKLMQEAVSAR